MGFLDEFVRRLNNRPRARVLPCVTSPATTPNIGPRGRPIVRIDRTRSLWIDRGWVERDGALWGEYRTPIGRFKGKIVNPRSTSPTYFIFNPPGALIRHREHGRCFAEKAPGMFSIHWRKKPRTIDIGILRIESLITEIGR